MTESDAAARLRAELDHAIATKRIGGAAVLQELAVLAFSCVSGKSDAQDSVAYALGTVLEKHADDRDDRLVTGGDTYRLIASGDEILLGAVKIIETGGSDDDATRIIAGLARLTPAVLYGH